MKKAKLFFAFLLVIALMAMGLFACNEGLPTGTDTGTDTDKSGQSSELPQLSFLTDEYGIEISYEGDYSFYVKFDDGEETVFLPGYSFDFSDEVGDHVISAYASDASGVKVAEGTFRYQTVEVTLSDLTAYGLEVTWKATARSVSVKERGSYAPVDDDVYVAQQEGAVVSVKAEGGFDVENAVYYVGDDVIKSVKVITGLDKPQLTVSGRSVTWMDVRNATSYMVSYDGGSFTSALSATLSDKVSTHRIEVKAVGNGITYSDSRTILEYETLKGELQVSKVASDTVVLFSDNMSFSVSTNGRDFSPMTGAQYVASKTTKAYFRSDAGYVADESKYYLASDVSEVELMVASVTDTLLDAGKTPSVWTHSEGVSVTSAITYEGNEAVSLNAFNNNVSHSFSAYYSLNEAYNGVSFLYRGDGVSSLTLSLAKQGSGFTLTRGLGVMPDHWVNVAIPFDDKGWTWEEGNISLATLWEKKSSNAQADRVTGVPARVMSAHSTTELAAFFDTLTFGVCGNAPRGAATSLVLAELSFLAEGESVLSVTQPLYDIGTTYVAYEEMDASQTNELILDLNAQDGFSIYSTALEENFTITGSSRVYEDQATLVLEDIQSGFAMELAFVQNGRALVVRSASGKNASHFPAERLFDKTAALALTFETEEAVADGWSAYAYSFTEEEWSALDESPISASSRNLSGVLCFRTGKNQIYKIVYNEAGEKLGLSNLVSLKLGNYDVGADALLLKLVAIDVDGTEYYLEGGEGTGAYYTLNAGDDLALVEYPIPNMMLRSLAVIVEYRGANDSACLYIDDLSAEYMVNPALFSDYPAPVIEAGEHAITFSYDENASIEYSVNGSGWVTYDAPYPIPEENGTYTVRARGILEANGAVTQEAIYTFTVEKVYVNSVKIEIVEAGKSQRVRWNTNSNIVSLRVDEKVDDKIVEGTFAPYDEDSYLSDTNATVHIRAEGYFDAENKKYYVGTVEVQKKIIVQANLGTPNIVATEEGLAWEEVEDANAYAVSINGGDEVIRSERSLSYAISEGNYLVRIRAVTLVENAEDAPTEEGEIIGYGDESEFVYTVKYVKFTKRPEVDKDTLRWTALACKVYVKDNNGDYVENYSGSYTAEVIGAHTLYVKAVAGYSFDENIYYYSESDVISEEMTIRVENMKTPTLLLHTGANGVDGLYWAYLNDSGDIVNTVEDMRGTHPFLTYSVSVNGGEWVKLDKDVYFFEELAEGVYSLRIRANGNGANYRDSKPSASYEFTIKAISLTDVNVDTVDGVVTATYDFVSRVTKRKIGTNGAFIATDEKIYTPSATTWLTLRVEGGWDEENAVYYTGNYIESESLQIIVPIKLATPVVTMTTERIEWSKVDYATGYRITVNGGEPNVQSGRTLDYIKEDGDFVVTIVAIHGTNPAQYPESGAVTVTYHRAAANVIYQATKTSVSWTYTGKLYRSFNKTDWEECYDNEFVNESGDEIVLYLKAEAETVITEQGDEVFIYYALPQEQRVKEISFIAYTLIAPVLTQDGMVLSWEKNDKATCFKYTLLPLHASDEDIATAEENVGSWSVIEKSDPHYIVFDQETYGDKLFMIKAIGNGLNVSDSVTTIRGLRALSLSEVEVTAEGVASWSKCGITKMQTTRNLASGYSDPEEYRKTYFAPTETTWMNLLCSGGYDPVDNVNYFGDAISREAIKIIVPTILAKPVVEMQATSIFINTVDHADKYIYTVNGGEEVTIDKSQIKTIDYAPSVGVYTVTVFVRSNDSDQYPDSQATTITYEVKEVSLSEVNANNVDGRAEFSAVGLLTVTESTGGRLEHISDTTFHYYPQETTTVTVTVTPGVDVQNRIKYIGVSSQIEKEIIVPIRLDAPTLSKGADDITISAVTHANGYRVKVDEGGWVDQTAKKISYTAASGKHTIYVKAYASNSTQYPDSEEVSVTFTTEQLALSDALTVEGATLSWSANARLVQIKVGKADYAPIETSSYTVTVEGSTKVTVQAYRGYLGSKDTYYHNANAYLQASATVTITKLDTPSLSVSGSKITWGAISGANGYEVKVGSGNYVQQSSTEKALSTQEGKFKVYVRAKGNGDTVLTSDAAILEYTTKNVALSDISVSGSTANWSSTAYKTSISVNGGSYSQTSATSYTPSSQGTYNIKIKAEGGWNNSSKIYYYTSKAIEKSATVKLYKLDVPALTATDKGLTWAAVSNATSYSVKIDSGSYNSQTDRSVTFSTLSGTHTVSVKAVGVASSGYQDSDVATFTYETKQTSFSILTTNNTMVTWICVGLKAQYSEDNGKTFKDAQYSGYTATKSGEVSFKAVGGYDASAKVFYNGTTTATKKSFTLPALALPFETQNDVNKWTKEVFNGNTNKWDSTTATAVSAVSDAYGAGQAIRFKSYMNGMAYRFGYQFGDMPVSYKSLSFDIKFNEYSAGATSLRFQDTESSTYVDYKFENLSASAGVWYHVTIYFEDSNLIINSGNKEYSVPKAISMLGSSTIYDKLKALDRMYFTVKGSYSDQAAYTYIDNIVFSTSAAQTSKTRITAIEKDFSDGKVNQNYTTSGWKAYKYGNSGFEENPNVMKLEDGSKALSLYCGGTTSKVTYNVGGSTLGEFNHFQLDVGTEASKVSYSIELVTESGESIYVAGGESYRATLSGTGGVSGMKTIVFNFAKTKIKSIIIYASESTGSGHFYVDNIIFAKLT